MEEPFVWAGPQHRFCRSCPASWCRGSSVTRSGVRPLTISGEAAVHEAPCWGELNTRSGGATVPDLRIPTL